MAQASNPTSVVIITEPGLTEQQITTALTSQPDFQAADVLTSFEKVTQRVQAAQADMILLDVQLDRQTSLDVVDELAGQFPDLPVLALLPAGDLVLAQQVMLAGARAFLFQPFTQVNLLSTLRRVRDLEMRRRASQATAAAAATSVDMNAPLRTLAVYSPRGGVGTSTLAINLALALFAESGLRVLLLEGKLFFGHIGLMLNMRVPNSVADLVPHANALEESILRDVVVQHSSGMHVLLAPPNMEVAQGVRPEALFNILNSLRRSYDYIVVDAGSHLSENTVTLMDAADRVFLVSIPELAALHDTSRFIQLSRSLAYPAGKILSVLNRSSLPGGVRPNDIETVLRHELYTRIPDDGPAVLRSINRGVPVLLRYPRSPVSRAIQSLARTLIQGPAVQPAEDAAAAKTKTPRLLGASG